ncbi:hypothetical protein C0L86_23875 [Streptomyces sp. SCA2-2]|nr:hypothetical protein C0L86_23875 [Streptomyces sp. SCA2-2]
MPERLGLEAFLVLAEELHFRRTAERLHVTTGRISQVLKKLEARVGAPLFARDSRIVTLTRIGGQPREDRQSDLGEGRCVTGLSACPAVRTNARGQQRASAARWIFVVSPPRERPMAWSPGSPAGEPSYGPRPRADGPA